MKKALLAAVAATIVAISPARAGPSKEVAQDDEGWRAAEKAAAQTQAPTWHGHIIYRSQVGR
jgi:hypothetical protein